MPLATASDVAVSLVRALTPSEDEHVTALLTRAENLIEEEFPDFSQRTEAGEDGYDPGFIKKVIHITADAVARVFRNPGAYRQETEGNYSYTLDREAASGLLTIEEREWQRLGIEQAEFGTTSVITDGYAAKRFGALRPDLAFQYGWPAPSDSAERII